MSIMDRNFWKRERRRPRREAQTTLARQEESPERWFDEFFRGFGLAPFSPFEMAWGEFSPRVDVIETEKELQVRAELPGMSEKEIEVSLSRDALTLSGEKKAEEEHRHGNVYRMERSYGAFVREFSMPDNADLEHIQARSQNGVLAVVIPKVARPEPKRINVQ